MASQGREDAKFVARDVARTAPAVVAAFLLAVVASALPARWRRPWELRFGFDSRDGALVSSLAHGAVGFLFGMAGFFRYMDAQLAYANAEGIGVMMVNPIQPIVYVLTTPAGFVSAVVALGGGVRLLGFLAVREVWPDPLLGVVDAVLGSRSRRAAVSARAEAKGDRTPDHIRVGGPADAFDLRIVTFDELDWHEGLGVMVSSDTFKVMRRFESHDDAGRLRNSYELKRLSDAEALRGVRRYVPPEPPVFE